MSVFIQLSVGDRSQLLWIDAQNLDHIMQGLQFYEGEELLDLFFFSSLSCCVMLDYLFTDQAENYSSNIKLFISPELDGYL